MNRRNFMRAILGTAAATALPSEVWPFRKIFLPGAPQLWFPANRVDNLDINAWGLSRAPYPGPLFEVNSEELRRTFATFVENLDRVLIEPSGNLR